FGKPDPGQAITAAFHADPTHFIEQFLLGCCAHGCCVSRAEGSERPIEPMKGAFRLLAPGDLIDGSTAAAETASPRAGLQTRNCVLGEGVELPG
ncbi:hypothetical protein, partial [Bradyrhizobium sp.]|uniref:hypothetical protein n=2 Tax=Bradyrhizobium sp. TaxID=376 RepID=UPI002900EB18